MLNVIENVDFRERGTTCQAFLLNELRSYDEKLKFIMLLAHASKAWSTPLVEWFIRLRDSIAPRFSRSVLIGIVSPPRA